MRFGIAAVALLLCISAVAFGQQPEKLGISVESADGIVKIQARAIQLQSELASLQQEAQKDQMELMGLQAKYQALADKALKDASFDVKKFQIVGHDKDGKTFGQPGFDISTETFEVSALPVTPAAKPDAPKQPVKK